MATYTKTVDPNGGADYSSIAAWEAGEQALYSSGDIAIADCRRTGATKDTTAVVVGGWTTGVIPKIIVNSAYRHEGKLVDTRSSDGNYIYTLTNVAASALSISTNSVVVDGLVVTGWGSAGGTRYGIGLDVAYDYGQITNCLVMAPVNVAASTMFGIRMVNGCDNWLIANNMVANIKTVGNTAYGIQTARGNLVYNNTVYNSGTGFTEVDSNNTMIYINNYSGGNTVADWAGGYSATSNYNVSSDATAPGTTIATGKTAYTDYFVDPANGDFHLKNTSFNLWGINSADLSATFTTDIDGDTRPASDQFGIGADYYVATGGTTSIAPAGSLTVTGSASTGYRSLLSSASAGAVTISGVSATSVKGFVSAAETGSLTITGVNSVGTRWLKSATTAGSIAITGTDSVGTYTPLGATISVAQPGAVVILGSDAYGFRSLISSTAPGALAVTGFDSVDVTTTALAAALWLKQSGVWRRLQI